MPDAADSARSRVRRLDTDTSLFRVAIKVLSAVEPLGEGTVGESDRAKKLLVRNFKGDTGLEFSGDSGRDELLAGGA